MSDDERTKKRKEHDDDDEADVEAHMYDDSGDLDPEKKRGKKRQEDFGGDEPERMKK